MKKIIAANAFNESVELYINPFFLISFQDGGAENNIKTQKAPYQDGSTPIDSNLEMREIGISVGVFANSQEQLDAYNGQIFRVFNPKSTPITILYDNGTKQRQIQVEVEKTPFFEDQYELYNKATIQLLAPNPFWLDKFTESEQMSYLLGGLKFPLRLGTSFSQRGFKRTIINQGDVNTPVEIKFYGPADNPVVYNRTTGEFIKVKRPLADGEILTIQTEFGNKSVKIGDVNVFNYIDLESTFWSLIPGANVIEFGSDNDSTKSKVFINFKNRYLSV